MRPVLVALALALVLTAAPAGAQLDGSLRGEIPSGLGVGGSGNRLPPDGSETGAAGAGGGGPISRDLTRRPLGIGGGAGGFIGQGPQVGVSGAGDLTGGQ